MLRRSGAKPLEIKEPLFTEEEIRKILGEDRKKEQIPDKNKILDKYKESKIEGSLIKIISHRNLLEKLNYTQEKK